MMTINCLDEQLREVVTLHYIEDLSVRGIGELLGIAEGTVKTRLYRGRKSLERIYLKEGEVARSEGK